MYININTNQYPVSEVEIRQAFPYTSFSVPFQAPEEYAVVFASPQPQHDAITEIAQEVTPVFTNKGTWEQQWQVVKRYANPEDEAAAIVAAEAARVASIKADIIQQTQTRLDQFAQTRGYDNILSATTYATSQNPRFAQEGQYAVQQRDATWTKLLEILAEVETGIRPLPTGYLDIEAELPTLTWPG